jgi:1,4-dihydroxy-6-naphthoate synthase
MDAAQADRFIGMYVNSWTLACGERGRQAVRELFEQGQAAGLLPEAEINLDFVTTDQASSTTGGEGTK